MVRVAVTPISAPGTLVANLTAAVVADLGPGVAGLDPGTARGGDPGKEAPVEAVAETGI